MSFNQKEYINNYNKENYKMFPFRIRKDDTLVFNKLNSVSSVNGYIYSLIENDINNNILTIKQIKDRIIPILKRHNINEIYLFGSYARGEATSTSDVDIFCEEGDIKTFIDQGYLEDELTMVLGKDVDIVFIGSRMDEYFKTQLDGDKIKIC